MTDITIDSVNESKVIIRADAGIRQELVDRYSFKADGYVFHPKFKAGMWDGTIRIISQDGAAPKGLVPSIIDYAMAQDYKVKLGVGFEFFREQIEFNWEDYDFPFEPKDYQIAAVDRILKKKRQVILSPTASGKSFIAHMTCRALEDYKILIIVPTISLVSQMFGDFQDYSVNNDWDVEANCHQIFGGKEKTTNKRITISTWQSLQHIKDQRFFDSFDAVICDEVHTAAAKVLTGLLDKCRNARIRMGLTGTLNGAKTNEMTLIGLFGPVFRMVTTKELMDRGIVTDLDIRGIILKHKNLPGTSLKYQDEINFIIQSEARNKFITRLARKVTGNTLILVTYIEKHGKPLYEMLKAETGKEVRFVYGGTEATDRENVRKLAEQRDDLIILASSQVFSTGVNVKNLHNIVFGSPSKSKIRILQSIGRGLRKHESKDKCTLFDIADDLRGTKKSMNHTLKHFVERMKIYIDEQFNVKTVEVDLE